jgi:hypothetical protein
MLQLCFIKNNIIPFILFFIRRTRNQDLNYKIFNR